MEVPGPLMFFICECGALPDARHCEAECHIRDRWTATRRSVRSSGRSSFIQLHAKLLAERRVVLLV